MTDPIRDPTGNVRLDKWLWAARLHKTRSLAQAACQGGKVDVNDQAAKPSRLVRIGDRLRVTIGEWRRDLVVRALDERRGPAARARELYEDLSPPPPPRARRALPPMVRAPGLGRPTKRERRLIERVRGAGP